METFTLSPDNMAEGTRVIVIPPGGEAVEYIVQQIATYLDMDGKERTWLSFVKDKGRQ